LDLPQLQRGVSKLLNPLRGVALLVSSVNVVLHVTIVTVRYPPRMRNRKIPTFKPFSSTITDASRQREEERSGV
jgi:hypothetical protein